jgi:hypothetical protein
MFIQKTSLFTNLADNVINLLCNLHIALFYTESHFPTILLEFNKD